MKKTSLLLITLFLAAHASAATVNNNFFINSRFIKDTFTVHAPVTNHFSAGAEVSYTDHDYFDDKIYTFALPVSHTSTYMQTVLKPFYTHKADDLYAFGIKAHMLMNMSIDEGETVFMQAYISAAFANQKADLAYKDGTDTRENFKQLVYTLGVRRNFYNAFYFNMSGNIFQYPDGISHIGAVRSVLDQQELANMQTYDVIFNLPKYSLGASFSRKFESSAVIYLSYNFTEYYTARGDHSIIIGNEFPIYKNISGDLAYNHIISVNNKKRDIYKAGFTVRF
ncbi:hypothetical protein Dip510_000238 [Elusimicrobium posterum]|uniref:hypothetical protein n=1 Tax=Elusimicrobium posterum TaxID=3116653 RepID=UPI003C76E5E8